MEPDELTVLLGPDWAAPSSDQSVRRNLARRLSLALRTLIVGDLLVQGTRLPSERNLAQALSVSRPTVTTAIDDLRAQGLVESRRGSGTWVAKARQPSREVSTMAEVVLVDSGINLAAAAPPDASHLGPVGIDLGDLMSVSPSHGYDPLGLPQLRERIAKRFGAVGLRTDSDDVIVTPGAHSALALTIGAVITAGDRVVVEEYTYGGVLDLIKTARAKPVVVPRDSEGVDPEVLDDLLRRQHPRLVYIMPTVHAPTGETTSSSRLGELAAVLDQSEAVVIVDETLADLGPEQRPPSLGSLCRKATVISIGSLSKIAWGGLRVGWIRATGPICDELQHHRSHLELGTSIPAQLIALQILDRFDELISDRRTSLAEKSRHLRSGLAAALPSWEVPEASGGLCAWVMLPLDDAGPFVTRAAEAGVVVMAGSMARPARGPDRHIRICFDRSLSELDEGVARLAASWTRQRTR